MAAAHGGGSAGAPMNANENNLNNIIAERELSVDEIKVQYFDYDDADTKSERNPAINTIGDFRNKDAIDALLSKESNYCVFYISTHGTCLGDRTIFECPPNTLLLQTGAHEFCSAIIGAGYDAAFVNQSNLKPTLYEMIGKCRTSVEFLESIHFSTPGQVVPNKNLTIESDDDPFKFGVFVSIPYYGEIRINDAGINGLLFREGGCTTDEMIYALNMAFPDTFNIFYFSSCSDIQNKKGFQRSYALWNSPTHGSHDFLTRGSVMGFLEDADVVDCKFESATLKKVTAANYYKINEKARINNSENVYVAPAQPAASFSASMYPPSYGYNNYGMYMPSGGSGGSKWGRKRRQTKKKQRSQKKSRKARRYA